MALLRRRLGGSSVLALCAAILLAAAANAATVCNMAHAPVCGADGITYTNRCIAESQGITVAAQGPCRPPPAAAAARAPPATAAFLKPQQLDAAATVGMDVMGKYAEEGYSFIGRVKTSDRRVVPLTTVRPAGPQAAAAAGVAGSKPFAVRITPTGDLYVGRLKDLPAGLTSTPPSPLPPRAAAAVGHPPHANATGAHRKLLAGNIVGNDDRFEIDVHASPFAAVGFVSVGCSGSMVGPRTVLTAGHCLWDPSAASWYRDYDFSPNRHSGGYHCHGASCYKPRTVAWEWAATPFVHAQNCGSGCIMSSDIPLDVAVIRLKEDTSAWTGYFGLQTSCGQKAYACRTAGYPSDKPDYGYRMWYTWGTLRYGGCAAWSTGSTASTTIDAYPGQSGSPAWTDDRYVRGVLSCTGNGYTSFRGMSDAAVSWVLKNRV